MRILIFLFHLICAPQGFCQRDAGNKSGMSDVLNILPSEPYLGMRLNLSVVRFEVFTAVTMKNSVFWDVTPCGSCKNRRFGGT
jgi:hypothetical protein